MEKLFLSREETANAIGVSTDTIDRLANGGHLKRSKIGGRTLFYTQDVRDFAAELAHNGAVSLW